MKLIYLFFLVSLLISCKSTEKEEDFVYSIESSHKKDAFLKNDAIQFEIASYFGTNEWIHGKMTLTTDSNKGKIEFKNGSQIIYNGNKVFYSKDILNSDKVRFDAYTVPYFFLLPYKLSDSGTIWSEYKNNEKDSLQFNSKKLTFSAGIGDASKDWYVLYNDKKTKLLEKAAYIVTASGNIEEAEKNPHAIQYLNYELVNGIPFATNWKFYEWKKDIGLTREIGNAKISNLKFVKTNDEYYKPSADFLEK